MGSFLKFAESARLKREMEEAAANGNTGTRENEREKSKSEPQIHYFFKPNSTTLRIVLIVIFYHILPFTALPNLGLLYYPFWLYKRSAYVGLSIYLGLMLLLLAAPPYYSKNVRRKVRGLYEDLAAYLPAAKFIIVPTEPLPEDKGYIFASHPHGRMFYSNAMFSQLHEIWRAPMKLTHGDLFQTAAGGFFNVPIIRNWFYMIGAMPADKKNIVEKLRNKDHVVIAVGGVREVCLGTQDDADLLYLKNRSGFLRIAMEEGAGVVPVYAFNENQLFKHDPRTVLNFWQWVNKYVKIGVPFMRGMYYSPIPYRKEILLVFGDALFSKEGESIKDFHERYIESVRQLFNDYVKYSPDPNHKLIIT